MDTIYQLDVSTNLQNLSIYQLKNIVVVSFLTKVNQYIYMKLKVKNKIICHLSMKLSDVFDPNAMYTLTK